MPPWIYTVLGRRWFRGAKRNGGSDFSKPPYRQWYRKAHEILCPSAVFFFSPLWGQMFLNWFTTSINYKCYTNVRGVFDFDRKTGWIVTKLGYFKTFFAKRLKSGADKICSAQTVDKAPSQEGAFLVSWLQKLCTYKHIRSSENAVFTGLFTTFLV